MLYYFLYQMCIRDSFGPMNQGLSREQAEEEAKKALAHVGVKEENFTKSPFELSGGQKKRVAIAGVLAMNPKILIPVSYTHLYGMLPGRNDH